MLYYLVLNCEPLKRVIFPSCLIPSISSTFAWKYDVFLSFRGDDTRLGFTSHLYNALKRSGIRAFMDDLGIKRGKEISDSLEQAIEGSQIVLVVLSPDYASSKWCLDELQQIMEGRATLGQLVTPIFYKVDPSDVRHQRGTYGDTMEQHEQRLGRESDWVLRWRQALTELANIEGFSYSACQYSIRVKVTVCVRTFVDEIRYV
ncbi:hypothetical protein K1719_042362 [Acacia pycnantha]|nr:hypothetical protein K1719_042362 [Acacia pycnantha]